MKNIFIFLFIFFLNIPFGLSIEEETIVLPQETMDEIEQKQKENIHKILYEESEEKSPYTKEALKGTIQKDFDLNSADGLFAEQLKLKFKKGLIKELSTGAYFQGKFSENIEQNSHSSFGFDNINVALEGKFNPKDEFRFLFDLTPNTENNFFDNFVLDAFVQTTRIKNHTVLFGSSRPTVGIEGSISSFLTPMINRSQTARTIANARKTGLKIKGDYKYFNYELGGYSSDTHFDEFLPGVEGDFWINFKPLANNTKYGALNIGGGLQAGNRNSTDFFTQSVALKYDYKKFWLLAEYQNADGSNGADGLTRKKRDGYNLTLAYRLTKKLEFLLRYDNFDNDKQISNNNTKEYSAGINYFILGQCLRLMFNYVYCDRQQAENSHKLLFMTQLLL